MNNNVDIFANLTVQDNNTELLFQQEQKPVSDTSFNSTKNNFLDDIILGKSSPNTNNTNENMFNNN